MVRVYGPYVCPGCGDELSVYDIEPLSISDVGAIRDDETGNFQCSECEVDYESVTAYPAEPVDALVEAAEHMLWLMPGGSAADALRAALAPFNSDTGSGEK